MEKTTIILDASALKESSCKLRLFNNVVLGYKEHVNNNDIEWGQAMHKFRSTFRQEGYDGYAKGIAEACEYWRRIPKHVKSNKKYLDEQFLMLACAGYATRYSKDSYEPLEVPPYKLPAELAEKLGGKILKLIEPHTRFMFPYYVDDEVEVLMAGTMDGIGKWNNGIICIDDLKTSSVWDTKAYFESYRLSPQLMFYKWALGKYIEAFPDSFLADLRGEDIGCFIDGVFYAGKEKPINFQRSEVFNYKEAQLRELEALISSTVNRLVSSIKLWRLDPNYRPFREGMLNGACQTVYGQCKYFGPCSAPDLESRNFILEGTFKRAEYNPMMWGE